MGLGKTLQTIAFLAYLKEVRDIQGPHLIVVPLSVADTWLCEFQSYCPIFEVWVLESTKELREEQIKLNKDKIPAITITSYQGMKSSLAYLMNFKFEYLIIDEAQKIKNRNNDFASKARMIRSNNRLLLSGTPLANESKELFNLMYFLMPEYFDCEEIFEDLNEKIKRQNQGSKKVFGGRRGKKKIKRSDSIEKEEEMRESVKDFVVEGSDEDFVTETENQTKKSKYSSQDSINNELENVCKSENEILTQSLLKEDVSFHPTTSESAERYQINTIEEEDQLKDLIEKGTNIAKSIIANIPLDDLPATDQKEEEKIIEDANEAIKTIQSMIQPFMLRRLK